MESKNENIESQNNHLIPPGEENVASAQLNENKPQTSIPPGVPLDSEGEIVVENNEQTVIPPGMPQNTK
ncbi:hypothetical protein [Melghirimyces algeriensis]|uniref:Uncharacterized protein n=1 Tax=Melghirimyces algeriensis TaxID=910412 RepID=A0A521FEI5_9BACL|nr:hypothetical protein [Melghirimyces algeriensis]SMO94606.1 hypothetical protein SAMN06264849_11760 [Melghirimyces algeriensis]